MGKKYIVEVGRLERLYKASVNGNGKPNITWLAPEVDLTPYTEPDLERVRKEAYKDGYDEACKDIDIKSKTNAAYRKGLYDAWECARKIALDKEDGGLDTVAYCGIFGYGKGFSTILKTFSASEAIEKIRAYEQEQEEIKVGDEVKTPDGQKMVVAAIVHNDYAGLADDGRFMFGTLDGSITKTGRHFPEIAAVLEKMRG